MGKIESVRIWWIWLGLAVVWALFPMNAVANDALCARVKIQINQELTLERQAFEAHMKISNGFADIPIEDVAVLVNFTDGEGNPVSASTDPDNTDALFFIRQDTISGIDNVDGTGQVPGSSSADITWLIIPAPGASNGAPQGILYYVGATLTYTMAGKTQTTEVIPDYIYVKPMPELTLDYFLPEDVYGDDAFTDEIEEEVPFPLGVRVANNGYGTAVNLSINSAQPEIVENELGLLIGFNIEATQVNGEAAQLTLKADFGDIGPGEAGVAKWIMTCSLSGKFVEFDADFSHSDELGGELTSLFDSVNTHFLLKDVMVDLPGRDAINDFLAKDGSIVRIYESDNVEALVTDYDGQLAGIVLLGEGTYRLTAPVTAGFMVVTLPDPENGQMNIKNVVRSDDKEILEENCWLSKTRDDDNNWHYFINLFDANTTASYTVVFEDPETSHVPVIQYISDKVLMEGGQVGFLVTASDPDGTIPALSAASLPAGAQFTDRGDGTGIFEWFTQYGQAGTYSVTFTADDGEYTATRKVKLQIQDVNVSDSDGDGMDDAWEMLHFGTLNRDGTGDYDGDGISDQDEYLAQTDPGQNAAPLEPSQPNPEDGALGVSVELLLSWTGEDPDEGDLLSYDVLFGQDAESLEVIQTTEETEVYPGLLAYDTSYFWQIVATDPAQAVTSGPVWQFRTFTETGDADGDLLLNYEEINLGTNPMEWDTDRDGFGDGEEYNSGSNPLNGQSVPNLPPHYGDLDDDDDVDGWDLYLLLSAWGLTSGDEGFNPRADLNEDGVIDGGDLDLFTRIFGYAFIEL